MSLALETSYAVPGWGRGVLWTRGGVVLAHELDFAVAGAAHARSAPTHPKPQKPPEGALEPPLGTVQGMSSPMGNGFVPESRKRERARPTVAPQELVERFLAMLAGTRVAFDDVELDLAWATPFQRAAADTLRSVPWGEVVTYGELAALAGYPGAARAAGAFCATNRFALLVPCHRVVAAGGIGGYGSAGVDVKRRLLALEGVLL